MKGPKNNTKTQDIISTCAISLRGINLLGRTIPGGIPVKGGIEVSEGRFPILAGNVEGGGIPRE